MGSTLSDSTEAVRGKAKRTVYDQPASLEEEMNDILRWLNWTPSSFPSATKLATKPPEPTKSTHEEGSVSPPWRESQEIRGATAESVPATLAGLQRREAIRL
jgi:hypothetical protein